MEQEAAAGTVAIPTGFEGSIDIQKLPSDDIIALRGRDLTGGTNWNVDPAQSVLWDTQLAYDSGVFSHSTTTNSHQITVNDGGDYLLSYNDALTTTAGTNNFVVDVLVNGTRVVGAQTKSHYISNGNGQRDSSGSLVYNLEGLSPADVVSVTVVRDANTTATNDRADAMLMLWKKKEFNFRPKRQRCIIRRLITFGLPRRPLTLILVPLTLMVHLTWCTSLKSPPVAIL